MNLRAGRAAADEDCRSVRPPHSVAAPPLDWSRAPRSLAMKKF
jgi:hypothetical protein